MFAYTDELKEWLKGRAAELEAAESGTIAVVAESDVAESAEIQGSPAAEAAPSPAALAPVLELRLPPPHPNRRLPGL